MSNSWINLRLLCVLFNCPIALESKWHEDINWLIIQLAKVMYSNAFRDVKLSELLKNIARKLTWDAQNSLSTAVKKQRDWSTLSSCKKVTFRWTVICFIDKKKTDWTIAGEFQSYAHTNILQAVYESTKIIYKSV